MISYIEGHITQLSPTSLTIEAGGIGYGLLISLNTYATVSVKEKEKEKVKIFVDSVFVRDDNPRYYGFSDEEERELFRKLISVSGVGGGSSLLMLSSLSPSEIAGAVNTANVALLKSVKGIGEKTAQRIVVDLKGKLGKHEGGISQILTPSYNKNRDEALLALVTLGFPRAAAEKALEKSLKQGLADSNNVETLIKSALKNL